MANERNRNQKEHVTAQTDAVESNNDQQSSAEQYLEDLDIDVTSHQSIDEYNHI